MNKVILLLTLFTFNSFATEVNFPKNFKPFLHAVITHAEPHDFDTIKLSNRYNKEFVVVCSNNPFHNNKFS